MSVRVILIFLAVLLLQNCQTPYIKGTKVPDTPKNREVYATIAAYKKAILAGRWTDLIKLVSPNFRETRGTPEKDDDYGYSQLKKYLQWLSHQNVRVINFSLKIEKIEFPKPDLAQVYVVKRYTMVYPRGKNRPAFDTGTILHRMVLEKRNGRWLFVRW